MGISTGANGIPVLGSIRKKEGGAVNSKNAVSMQGDQIFFSMQKRFADCRNAA